MREARVVKMKGYWAVIDPYGDIFDTFDTPLKAKEVASQINFELYSIDFDCFHVLFFVFHSLPSFFFQFFING